MNTTNQTQENHTMTDRRHDHHLFYFNDIPDTGHGTLVDASLPISAPRDDDWEQITAQTRQQSLWALAEVFRVKAPELTASSNVGDYDFKTSDRDWESTCKDKEMVARIHAADNLFVWEVTPKPGAIQTA